MATATKPTQSNASIRSERDTLLEYMEQIGEVLQNKRYKATAKLEEISEIYSQFENEDEDGE